MYYLFSTRPKLLSANDICYIERFTQSETTGDYEVYGQVPCLTPLDTLSGGLRMYSITKIEHERMMRSKGYKHSISDALVMFKTLLKEISDVSNEAKLGKVEFPESVKVRRDLLCGMAGIEKADMSAILAGLPLPQKGL